MLPTGVKNLLIINVIFWLASMVCERYGLGEIPGMMMLWPTQTPFFRWWQPITYMLLHANFEHLFFNMFALWMFGYVLENFWGTRRFVAYYLLCGVGAGVFSLLVALLSGSGAPSVGASGAVYGILLAFGMMFPNERIYLYFLMPIKAKWFVIGYAAIELFQGIFLTNDGVAHFAHLGGMVVGLLLILWWRKHPFSRW